MPKISVIVPIYKVEKYLNKCVDSVLNQMFKDFEIILVDDGSPDNCPAICDEYAAKYDFVHVIHKENGGLSDARNAGLNLAKGEYIYFCDSDDYISPYLLERCYNVFQSNKSVDLVRFPLIYIYNGRPIERKVYENDCIFEIKTSEQKYDFLVNTFLQYKVGYEACGCVFKSSIIKNHNIKFYDNRIIFAEDQLFSLQYMLFSEKLYYINEPLYYYVKREDSITGQSGKTSKINEVNNLSYLFYNYLKDDYIKENYFLIHYYIISYFKSRLLPINTLKQAMQVKKILTKIEKIVFFKKYNKEFYKNTKRENLKSLGFFEARDKNRENAIFYKFSVIDMILFLILKKTNHFECLLYSKLVKSFRIKRDNG